MKCIDHDSWGLVAALVRNCRVRDDYCQSGPSLLLFFLVKFQLTLFVLSSQAMELLLLEIMEAMRSFPLQFSFKARPAFFFLACCFAACRHGESIEGVLPLEGVRKFSKCLPAFPGQPSLCGVAPVPWDWDYATRFDLVISFLTSMLRLVHSDSASTLRTHTHCERALSCLATRKVKTETEVEKVECLLLCLGRRAVLEEAVHDQLLWLFNKFSKPCKKGTKCARTVRALKLDLSLDFRPPNSTSFVSTPCWENALVRLCPWAKKTVIIYFHISVPGTLWRLAKVKSHPFWWFMPSRPMTPISKKAQSSSCSDLDSEVTVPVPRQTEVSMSVWGKPSELGISLLSTNQRTFIYTGPQALSWRPSTIRSQVGPGSRLNPAWWIKLIHN